MGQLNPPTMKYRRERSQMTDVFKISTKKIESEVCEGLLEWYSRASRSEHQLLMQRPRLEMRRKILP